MTALSAEEIREVWDGRVRPIPSEQMPARVPTATREFLTTIGLPTVPVFDISFRGPDQPETILRQGDREYLVFAENTSGSVFGVDLESEQVYRVYPPDAEHTVFYNSDIALFVYFHGLLRRNVLDLTDVDDDVFLAAVNNVWELLTEQDPAALADDAPWLWTLSDLESG